MAHRTERGNILGFVLVGAVLVSLLVGGIYVVRHRQISVDNRSKTENKTVAKTDTKKADKSDTKTTTATPTPTTTGSPAANDQQLKAALDAQSSSDKKPAPTTTSTTATTTAASMPTDTTTQTSTSVDNLPTTGPEQAVAPMIGAALLIGTAVSYTRSRRLI